MFVYQDDEGTVTLFTTDVNVVNQCERSRRADSVHTVAFLTLAPNMATANILLAGFREHFKHEGDLRFEAVMHASREYEIVVSKNMAPF